VLCALGESLELFRSDPAAEVLLEGLEDADLRPTLTSGQLLLQMKHYMNPWKPRAFESFLESLRLNHDLRFAFLLDGPTGAFLARAGRPTLGEARSSAIDELILGALQSSEHTTERGRWCLFFT